MKREGLDTVSKDILRHIVMPLPKRDLLCLQLASPRLQELLDRLPEVWHGKHAPDFALRMSETLLRLPMSPRDKWLLQYLDKRNKWARPCRRNPQGPEIVSDMIERHGILMEIPPDDNERPVCCRGGIFRLVAFELKIGQV